MAAKPKTILLTKVILQVKTGFTAPKTFPPKSIKSANILGIMDKKISWFNMLNYCLVYS